MQTQARIEDQIVEAKVTTGGSKYIGLACVSYKAGISSISALRFILW
jgi:hypothetical protein